MKSATVKKSKIEASALRAAAEATSALVVQDAKDIKIRLSRSDIFDLCLHEAKSGLEKAYEIERQRCVNLRDEVLRITKEIENEVTALMKKRYAKVSKVMDELAGTPSVQNVSISYQTSARIVQFSPESSSSSSRRPGQEKRPSFLNGFRARRSRVDGAKIEIGVEYGHSGSHRPYFRAHATAVELGTIETVGALEATVNELDEACDRLDYLKAEISAFEKRSQHAKQALMKKILESSDKGRGILDLARSLAKEIDLVAPSQATPTTPPSGAVIDG